MKKSQTPLKKQPPQKSNAARSQKTGITQKKNTPSSNTTSAPNKPRMSVEEIENSLVELIRKSALYDENWYKTHYSELTELDIDFARHYVKYGWQEGKAPSANFSGKLYLEVYSDVAKLNINPLIHYELRGKQESRNLFTHSLEIIFFSNYFDHNYYQKEYGLGALSRLDAATDYLSCGEPSRYTSRYFNANIYLTAYSDVEASNMPALLHYELHGRIENRAAGVSHASAKFQKFENKNNIDLPAKRVCLFACYSADGTFTDETVHLLEQVRSVTDCIILVGDCGVNEIEFNKIKHLIYFAQFERHLEYDFGSYKRAFTYAECSGLLSHADEILVCNDSIVGPCGNLNQFFQEREKDGNPSFYGITVNNYGFRNVNSNGNSIYSPHVQSYFFTITREIFEAQFWKDFIYSVKSHENKIDIIRNYEMGMSKLLEAHGYPPRSMYKSRAGLNPAALEPEDVLNKALFIKKSMLHKFSGKKSGLINGIFKAKSFPFELKGDHLVTAQNASSPSNSPSSNPKLKIVDCEILGSSVFLFAVSGQEPQPLELLVSTEKQLLKFSAVSAATLNVEKYVEMAKSYLQRSLNTYIFHFHLSLIDSGASLNFSSNGKAVPIEYIHGNLPCHNFMRHRELNLYPRIEKNTLFLSSKDKAILAIMLSDSYTPEDKQLFADIINSKHTPQYNLFSERSSLVCDNAFEAFKFSLRNDKNSFFITSKAVISNEKDTKLKSHMIEFGSPQHINMLLSAKNLFCSFGYPGIIPSGLKDIHITALNYKLHLMWHGISAGDKNSYEIAAFNGNSCDSVLACSSFEEANFKKLGHNNVYLTGYPRMDKWANDSKLDPNALILFFTWRRNLLHSSLAEFLESEYVKTIIDLVERTNKDYPNFNIFYFIHNSVPSKHSEILAAILRSKSANIRFVNNNDQAAFNKIFNSAQYMITDYSSVGYDFAYYKKRSPVFYMPEKFITGHYAPTALFSQIQPGVQALDLDSVMRALNPNEFKKHEKSAKQFFAFSDANNCERSLRATMIL